MKGFPQHATSSTFKQHATNSAFKQQQMTVPGADDLTDEQREKFEKFEEKNKVVYYEGEYIPLSEMKKLEQERINRINAKPDLDTEVKEDKTADASGVIGGTKRAGKNINIPKTGIGKVLSNMLKTGLRNAPITNILLNTIDPPEDDGFDYWPHDRFKDDTDYSGGGLM